MSGRNIYLSKNNAENILNEAVELLKEKAAEESRSQAFADCTEYWKKQVEAVINEGSPSGAKLSRIRTLFGIPFKDEE